MSYIGSLWRGAAALTGAAFSAGSSIAQGIERRARAARLQPSRAALKSGILCPGDGPPSGSIGSFLDYREIHLPDETTALGTGTFPIGRAKHPRSAAAAYPMFLNWEDVRRHVAVVGPAGSGKTSNLMVPWVVGAAEAGLGVVVVDSKGDFLQEIAAYKARLGLVGQYRVIRWDIQDPAVSRPWNPLAEVRSINDAAQVALAFLGEIDPQDHQRQYAERDHRWLRGLAYLMATVRGRHGHARDLYALIVNQQALLSVAQRAQHAVTDIVDLLQFPAADYTRATWGLANKLSWLAEPGLAGMLDGTTARSFTLRDAIDSGAIIVIGARVSGGERTMTAAALMLNLLKLRCMEHFTNQGPRMLWVLDEAPKYARRIELEHVLDFMRGAGVAACIGLQDVAQLGDETAQSRVLANADTMIVLKGASAASASLLSKRLGDVQAATVTTTPDPRGGWAPTLSHHSKPMLGTREIMHPPVGHYGGIVHLRGSTPYPFLITFD